MFCAECGKEIQENWKTCPNCGKRVDGIIPEQVNNQTPLEKKKRTIFKKRYLGSAIIVLAIFILWGIGSAGTKQAEFGRPIVVDDVAYISFNYGTFFEGAVYPLNAIEDSSYIEYAGDGVMYGIYGVIENLSSKRFDVDDIFDIKLIFDDKYESNALIWLENEEQTEFLGYDLSDQVYLSPDAIINPKDKYYCVLIGQVGNAVYQDAKEVTVELKIMKDPENLEDYVTYKMPLVIEDQ